IYESKNKQNGKILVAAVGIMLVLFGSVIDIERDGSWEVESFIDETEESQRYVERVEDKASEEVPMESVSDEAMRQNSLSNRTIAEILGMDLFLTYGQFDWQGYSDISLHYKGQNLPISGTTMADSMFMPLLALLENSSKAAVILIEAEGSGLYLTNIHMVDLEQFSEVPCEDAVEYLDHKINSTVERENGIVNLELPDRILQFDVSGINSPANLYDQVYYGGIVEYHVENDMLCCNVILHIAPGSDLGNIRLEYELIEKEYKVIHMEFQEFSDNQAPYTVMEK
nr:hypothetical protein [Lachnospiraceae bacterium]